MSPADSLQIVTAQRHDLPFLDSLQKKFGDEVGFLPRPAILDYIDKGFVLLALENNEPAGYIVRRHQLRSRQGLGSIVQAAVCLDAQRRYIGEALVNKALRISQAAELSGVQSCCAVGLPANDFWLAMGFVPVCHFRRRNVRHREIICWRRPLTKQLPTWFAEPPKRVGYPPSAPILTRDPNRPKDAHADAIRYLTARRSHPPDII